MRMLLTFFTSLYLTGCSVVGMSDVETPNYKIVEKDGAIEVRAYPPLLVAQTTVEKSDFDDASNKAFRKLADYIFGNNTTQTEISMTAPVTVQNQSTEIDMTAPVFVERENQNMTMRFVMPGKYTMETIPKPKDDAITLKELPAQTYAAIRFRGFFSQNNIKKHEKELLTWLENSAYTATGRARAAGYNPPWTLPFFKRNEVLVPVKAN